MSDFGFKPCGYCRPGFDDLRARLEAATVRAERAEKDLGYYAECHAKLLESKTSALERAEKADDKAAQYARDWYAAKAEFGTASRKLRERIERAEAGAAAMRAALEGAYDFHYQTECVGCECGASDAVREALESSAGREMLEALEWARGAFRVLYLWRTEPGSPDVATDAAITKAPALVRGEK